MVKKFVALLLAHSMVSALTACGANITPTTQPDTKTETLTENNGTATIPEYTIKFAAGSTANLENPQNVVGTYKFKELTEERSNDLIAVECYIDSTLGDVTTIMEQVQMGAIEMCDVENGTMANFVQECALWNLLPCLFASLEEVHKIQESDIGKNTQAQCETIGIKYLAFNDGGFRYFSNSKHEIASAGDFKCLKFSVMNDPLYVSMMEALGASATIIAFAEFYTALQQGTFDGQENPSTSSTRRITSRFRSTCPSLSTCTTPASTWRTSPGLRVCLRRIRTLSLRPRSTPAPTRTRTSSPTPRVCSIL